MKRIFATLLTAFAMLTLVSCADGMMEEINALKARLSELESSLSLINDYYSNTSKIISALEDHDMIKSVTPVSRNAYDAYLITFASGQTLTLIQGIDGVAPNLGIRKYEDGNYYWTVQYGSEEPQWLLSSLGLKIRASGLTPQMRIEDGWWQYSYDGGATWIRLSEATGDDGKSVFKNISVSDYFVTFSLSTGGVFQIPTEAYMARITEKCNTISEDLESAAKLLAPVDSMQSVKKISQIVENGEIKGYTLQLLGGEDVNIYLGEDEQPFSFTIRRDYTDWTDYWMVKVGDGDYTWVLRPNGERAQASAMSAIPRLSVRDTLDAYYFVYSFYPDVNDYQWLKDAEGNLVPADPYGNVGFFKAVSVDSDTVTMTMADGSTIYMPLARSVNPSIAFDTPAGMTYDSASYLYSSVSAGQTYSVGYTISNASDSVKLDAIGMDGATVTGISRSVSGKQITGNITFTTPAEFSTAVKTTRVLVFLTWGSSVTMQVLEFNNGE